MVEKKAPTGMFRVVGVDTFSDEDWVQGDYKTLQEAIDEADERGAVMTKMYVYDDAGTYLHEAGKF